MWKRDFEATNLINKEEVDLAWKTDLAKSCGSSQLAVALLKHLTTVLRPLLESWKEYMSSRKLRSEGERCKRRRRDQITPETSEAKHKQSELKNRVSRLRNLRRRMEKAGPEGVQFQ